MSAEATLILPRVVVANELAQQEEAHGDSKKKVKRHQVDVTYALDWRPPYHGGASLKSRMLWRLASPVLQLLGVAWIGAGVLTASFGLGRIV